MSDITRTQRLKTPLRRWRARFFCLSDVTAIRPERGYDTCAPMGSQATAILIFAALVIAVLFLEAAVRILQRRYRGATSGVPQALRDRFVAWRLNPKYRRIDIQHNRGGFRRSSEVSVVKPPGTVRIFLMGGSAIYGAQGAYPHIEGRYSRIHNHELIDAFLEQLLRESYPAHNWEVINCASSGYRVHQQLALLQSRLLRYRPDFAVIIDGYNDFIQLYDGARLNPEAAGTYDVYENTAGIEEFDDLANPGSLRSLLTFGNAWLRANSALVRAVQGRVYGAVRDPWKGRESREQRAFSKSPLLSDLTPEERLGATTALSSGRYYGRIARHIGRVSSLEGVKAILCLQPILILSNKQLTESEQRLTQYERDLG